MNRCAAAGALDVADHVVHGHAVQHFAQRATDAAEALAEHDAYRTALILLASDAVL